MFCGKFLQCCHKIWSSWLQSRNNFHQPLLWLSQTQFSVLFSFSSRRRCSTMPPNVPAWGLLDIGSLLILCIKCWLFQVPPTILVFQSVVSIAMLNLRSIYQLGPILACSRLAVVVSSRLLWSHAHLLQTVSVVSWCLDTALEVNWMSIKQPQASKIYYDHCEKIDQHRQMCQDDLAMEKKIGIHNWSK